MASDVYHAIYTLFLDYQDNKTMNNDQLNDTPLQEQDEDALLCLDILWQHNAACDHALDAETELNFND